MQKCLKIISKKVKHNLCLKIKFFATYSLLSFKVGMTGVV